MANDPMSVAFLEARAAEARDEVPVGAALARAGVVIASAGNRTREDSDPRRFGDAPAVTPLGVVRGASRSRCTRG